MAARLASAPSSALRLLPSAVGCRPWHTPELFRLETSASSGLPAFHNRLRKCSGFRERALNTVQTDTRRRCSNTPSLAALPVATTLRSHHRAHSRSRHRATPGRGTTATLTGVHRSSRIVYRDLAEASINNKRYTINARYSGTSICRHPLPTSRHTPGQTIALRLAAYAPRQRRERWARLSWRHPNDIVSGCAYNKVNSLRSGVPCHGFAHPLRAAAALSAAHLRATHSPDDMRIDIGNDTRTLRLHDYSA